MLRCTSNIGSGKAVRWRALWWTIVACVSRTYFKKTLGSSLGLFAAL